MEKNYDIIIIGTGTAGKAFAASKVIIDEANDRIMGAYILGPNAREAISIFAE